MFFYQKLSAREETVLSIIVWLLLWQNINFGRGKFVVTDQSKVLIAATYVMLTFGMRHYLIDVF
jgi:hypothetical protein